MRAVHDHALRVFVAAKARFRPRDERGTGLLEYVLLVSLIALVALTAVTLFGETTCDKFDEVPSDVFGSSQGNARC